MWEYLNTAKYDARLLPIAGYLVNQIQGKALLDLNCGYARLADYLPQSADYFYIGNDIDENAHRDFCERYTMSKKHFFWVKPDDWVSRADWPSIDILVCTGYATGFGEFESNTLDDSVKKLINRYGIDIIILEGATMPLINSRMLSLCDWIISKGYSEEFNFKIDVMEKPDVWQLRNVVILKRNRGN